MFIESRLRTAVEERVPILNINDHHNLSATIRQAQLGDHKAFEQLYRENVNHVYAVCLRIAADTVRAEELTQDIFVRTWEMLATFRGESAFSTWLHRLAVNVVLVHLRSTRRRTSRVQSVDDLELYDSAENSTSPGTAIDLEEAITKLPPHARAIFVLHDIEGYKHTEIAEQLGIAVGTTKAQLHRARRILKEVLER